MRTGSIAKTAPLLPGLADASDALRIAKSFAIESDGFGRPVRLDRLPAPDERQVMQERNMALTRSLRAANLAAAEGERARAAIAVMLEGYPSLRRDDLAERVELYWLQLGKFPLFAIMAACEDIAQRRVPELDPDWPPSSPRLIDLAKRHVAKLATEQHLLDRVLGARQTYRPAPTAGEKQRIEAGLRDLANAMNVSNELIGVEDRRARAAASRQSDQAFILREYRRLGLEPRYMANGMLLSPALLEKTGAIAPAVVPPRR